MTAGGFKRTPRYKPQQSSFKVILVFLFKRERNTENKNKEQETNQQQQT